MKGKPRILNDEQIEEAKHLRENLGYTKRELAKIFNVGETTIWNNLYGRQRRTKRIFIYRRQQRNFNFANIKSFVIIVENMRLEGLNSGEIAHIFNVPIEEINLIWCKSL